MAVTIAAVLFTIVFIADSTEAPECIKKASSSAKLKADAPKGKR